MTVFEIQRGSQGGEIHVVEDEYGEFPLVIIPHDAPNADYLEQLILEALNKVEDVSFPLIHYYKEGGASVQS